MNKRILGQKLMAVSGIVGVVISITILILNIVSAGWRFHVLLNIPQIFLHIYLFAMGYFSRAYRDMKTRTLLICGLPGVLLSGYIFVSMISIFLLVPTLRAGLYLLTFPVTVLFLIGVLLLGNRENHS